MVEWAVAIVVFVGLLSAMVALLPRAKRGTLKGAGGGFVLGLGMIFASLLDPARAAAVEEVERRKETQANEEGEGGAPPS
jgi:hypothetical protein